ncbi:hypothetical protein FACS189472_17800 [Alphaproteobacteria bacterium]|nr:hypothetical protein FACS189472_17800 [Alphaproteobacteria bacterium]
MGITLPPHCPAAFTAFITPVAISPEERLSTGARGDAEDIAWMNVSGLNGNRGGLCVGKEEEDEILELGEDEVLETDIEEKGKTLKGTTCRDEEDDAGEQTDMH